MSKQNHASAHHRIMQKQHDAAVKQALATLPQEYIDKLRHDSLRSAHERLHGASPEDVVREAAKDFESRVRFLVSK
jgi:hypothetical protein